MTRIHNFLFTTGIFLLTTLSCAGQYVPTHRSNDGIYQFLDELATEHIIDLYSLVKPYSRIEIAKMLANAADSSSQLNRRQMASLEFYSRDYCKELDDNDLHSGTTSWLWQKHHGNKRFDVFHYRDSLFQITVNPVLGSDFGNNANGSFYHLWNGIEAWSYTGRFGIWASLRDNHESTELTARDFQNQRIGGSNFKIFAGGKRDYWELRGGIAYSWKWGHVGLIMGQFEWGENNAGSNILSGRTPAFPRIELAMKPASWFRFTYIHGALVSEVVDSTLSFYTTNGYGTEYREVYHPKYMAANIFSFIPWKGLQLSIGNSVIYDFRYPHAAFFLPVAFYKAIDHTLDAGINNMNSQLFLSVSSRNFKHVHLYGSIFLDELAADRIFDPQEHNFVSYKAGAASTLLRNTRFLLEYTWSNALAFRHNVPTITFESNSYNLGHYLEDNARELFFGIEYKPYKTLIINPYLNISSKGPDHTMLGTMPRETINSFEPLVWESKRAGILARYQIVNDLYARLGFEWRNVTGEQAYLNRWTPEEFHGQTGTFRMGLNYGF